jgi:protein-S-isoprenylcysteine O-methyltransferase Ste14
MNYTGDLIMAIAYCLPCGSQIGGYLYAFYLFTLLTHRAYRDDAKCRHKYAKDWATYTSKVPYVFVPFELVDIVLRGIGKALYALTNKEETVNKSE